MSFTTVADLRRASVPTESGCWSWQRAMGCNSPRIHAFDYDRGEKSSLSGPKAVYFIAFRAPLRGRLAYRCCFRTDCVNPDHIRTAVDKAEIGRALSASGVLKGSSMDARRRNVERAHAARGITPTPAAIVLAVRAEPSTTTNVALASRLGIDHRTLSRIRLGKARVNVIAQEA
jgi:hypothetical protein